VWFQKKQTHEKNVFNAQKATSNASMDEFNHEWKLISMNVFGDFQISVQPMKQLFPLI
jgi:hypothetical protein